MINLDHIQNRTINIPIEAPKTRMAELKILFPAIISGAILKGLGEISTKYPQEQIVSAVTNFCNYSTYGVLILGVITYFHHMDKSTSSLKDKRVQYIKMSQEDFLKMKEEIIYLRQNIISLP